MFSRLMLRLSVALALFAFAGSARATGGYATQPPYSLTLPGSELSFATSADVFDGNITTSVEGFPLRGRFLAATGRTVYLQKNFGADLWLPVATLGPDDRMDPCFVKISPDGKKIALGVGFYKPLIVFDTALLSVSAPPNLRTEAGVKIWDENMYDGAWRGNRYLFINAASDTGSQIYAIDTEGTTGTPIPIMSDIPGASGGLAFDAAGDLVTGVGLGGADAATGQLKIWPAASVDAALGGAALAYLTTGKVLIEGALSAASLGFDTSGNLFVGGGDVFGTSGHYGYAGLVSAAAVQQVLAGGATANPESAADYVKIQPDPCHNDDATNVWYAPSLGMLVVTANLSSMPPDCGDYPDMTHSGPDGQQFFSPNAPDTDGDGIPDGADNAYLTPNPDQKDADGDGWGDAADCDADNNGTVDRADLSALMAAFGSVAGEPSFAGGYDFNHDGHIDFVDFTVFKARWGSNAVCE